MADAHESGQAAAQNTTRRPARSRNGCQTCRRRKVRCNEQRPRCSHCQRLSLECQWLPLSAASHGGGPDSPRQVPGRRQRRQTLEDPDAAVRTPQPQPQSQPVQAGAGVDHFFDYANFLWAAGDSWSQVDLGGDGLMGFADGETLASSLAPDVARTNRQANAASITSPNTTSSLSTTLQDPLFHGEDGHLLAYFHNTVIPPILDVDQKKWKAMRRVLLSMAASSSMVRHAILAFSNLLRFRRETPWMQAGRDHYDNARSALADNEPLSDLKRHSVDRQNLLATLFFLCYIDILEDRMEITHTNLKRAYEVFIQGDKGGFHPVESQLLSWIRLLDARAVSAGGQGLFLTDESECLLAQPSPASLTVLVTTQPQASQTIADNHTNNHTTSPDRGIEDVLFDLLHQPGAVFYQKVQSFMGRISQIDPWHRERGTVDSETAVMNLAAGITRDLRELHASRPVLMDHAVAGILCAPLVAADVAAAVTRAFRTYLANYHASRVHLHRVAYKHLPLPGETVDSLEQIRHLARLLVEDAAAAAGTENSEEETDATTLPVNMLWPLLMWGTEEKDRTERGWIKEQIIGMEKAASNARATAQVLEEVQRRQDEGKSRVDIRGVMHEVFDSCWAIV